MNRRTFLGASAVSLASFFLPAPRPRLDLLRFCAQEPWGRYDLRLPFVFRDFAYASDAHCCLRVPPATADQERGQGEAPPFTSLSWNHDCLRGWRSLPKLDAQLARDSYCPTCDGYGHLRGEKPAVCDECERCGGTGVCWAGSNYDLSYPVQCRTCKGLGHVQPAGAVVCPTCQGYAVGVFPSVTILDGRYFDAQLYEKVRTLGGEYVHDQFKGSSLLKFRFDGGDGVLMGLDSGPVERRLVGATP